MSVMDLLLAADQWAIEAGTAAKQAHVGVHSGVVCLSASGSGAPKGRWTFIAARPLAILSGERDDVRLKDCITGAESVAFDDPFKALEEALEQYTHLDTSALDWSPFRGGAVGMFGYGCRHTVERGLPADPSSRWGEPDVWWGLYDTFIAWDGWENQGTVVSWGIPAWGQPPSSRVAKARVDALCSHLRGGRFDAVQALQARSVVGLTPTVTPERYASAFRRIKSGIASGEMYQGCLTFPMRAERHPDVTALTLFEALRRWSPAPYGALIAAHGPVALVSSSPELFLKVSGRRVWARPMKGTRPRSSDPTTDRLLRRALEVSTKDRAENIMIVDLMRNDLGRVCRLGSIRVPKVFTVERYRTVHQMTSTVEGSLPEHVHGLEAVKACFPPGSMTGAPKIQAMRVLSELEEERRGLYSGVLGWVSFGGDLALSVIIRAAIVSDAEVAWHVGGGLVADSQLEDEWQESLDKCPKPLRAPHVG